MDIVKHPNTTQTLPAPPDWNNADGPCEPLPVICEVDSQGQGWMTSFWRPSDEEIARLRNGAAIALTVAANTPDQHPVVGLAVHTI
ncbi:MULTISPECIES: hypothetical protein [Achromobacter]|uniref:hypothetical protein n=1 Tax=Achromobacter TaxID=222 RepID=UPI0023F8F809|nr:hypothetical protein [Achromobacter anxifer]MDF8365089.1 hypothetical protein [Achromobacter anxifer]